MRGNVTIFASKINFVACDGGKAGHWLLKTKGLVRLKNSFKFLSDLFARQKGKGEDGRNNVAYGGLEGIDK